MDNYTPYTRNTSVFLALAQGLPEAPLSRDDRESVRFLQQVLIELGKMVPGAIRFASGLYGQFTAAAVADVAEIVARSSDAVCGVLIPSFLLAGRQKPGTGTYGMSVTGPCLDWSSTADALESLASAVRTRRAAPNGGGGPNKKSKH